MHWLNDRLAYTPTEVATIVRGVLVRMLYYTLLGAVYAWTLAQVAVLQWGLKRPYVGYVAVAVTVAVPFLGSLASYGYWWWKPRPMRRLANNIKWLFRLLRRNKPAATEN